MIVTPNSLGGTPQTMPTNNWWTGAGAAIESFAKVAANTASGLATSFASVQDAKARLRAADVPSQNRPPGTQGLNAQAAGIAGGQVDTGAPGDVSTGVALLVAGIIVVLVMMARK